MAPRRNWILKPKDDSINGDWIYGNNDMIIGEYTDIMDADLKRMLNDYFWELDCNTLYNYHTTTPANEEDIQACRTLLRLQCEAQIEKLDAIEIDINLFNNIDES